MSPSSPLYSRVGEREAGLDATIDMQIKKVDQADKLLQQSSTACSLSSQQVAKWREETIPSVILWYFFLQSITGKVV